MRASISAGWQGRDTAGLVARALTVGCLLAVITQPTGAASQEASPRDQTANTGEDFFRPPRNLFQMMYQYRTAPGSGSTPGSIREVTTDTLNLRIDHSVDLAPLWTLALRSDLPLLAKNPITSSNPDGNYLSGVGDADFQAAIIHDLDQRWAVGFGARLTAPTGGDTLGSGKWQIMPAAGLRYALPEIDSSSNSIQCRTASVRPADSKLCLSCNVHPGLPETTAWAPVFKIFWALRLPSSLAASGCSRL